MIVSRNFFILLGERGGMNNGDGSGSGRLIGIDGGDGNGVGAAEEINGS